MYTFLAGFFVDDCADRLRRSASRILGTLPSNSVQTRCELREIDEVAGGWLIVRPSTAEGRPRISECATPDFASLVVGTTTTATRPAEAVLEWYQNGGLAEVREMEGNFSAIIVDRRRRELFACSDCIGTRALRFTDSSEGLYIAIHDAALIAGGCVNLDLDYTSAASGVLCGWSLQGRPLLSGCRVIGPDHVLKGDSNHRELIRDSFLDRVSILPPADVNGVSRTKEALQEALVSTLELNLGIEQPDRVRLALTAGVDTRAALALLRATSYRNKLVATTTGGPASIDVRWARRICRSLDIEHSVVQPSVPTHASFARNLELLAYVTNGDTDGKRALSGAQSTAPGSLLVSGLGGEIFRGYYYPCYERARITQQAPEISAKAVRSLLVRKTFPDFSRIPIHVDLKRQVEDRLEGSLRAFDAYARNVYGYLDCFYLRERYGVWGALNSRKLWSRSLAPFHSVRGMLLAARLPPPWGNQRIQAEIIETYLPPQLYWMPVNGAELLNLQGPGTLKFLLRDSMRRAPVLAGRFLPQPKCQKSHERIRAELLAHEVYDFVRELLTVPGSLALDLLPKPALEQLLETHRKRVNHAKLLGYLATLESWRVIAQKARAVDSPARAVVHTL